MLNNSQYFSQVRLDLMSVSANPSTGYLCPLKGLQQTAFEEVCCQLAAYDLPQGAIFIRKGFSRCWCGVLCYPTGSKRVGLEAKFFDPKGQSQWQQLDKSVKTALDKHPLLARYIICLPVDFPDPRLSNQKSQYDKWIDTSKNGEAGQRQWGRKVSFEKWKNHELVLRLS